MRVACLVTYTDCENKWRSLEAAGHQVTVIQYDDRPHERHGEIVEAAHAAQPDAIVYIGAVERYHGRPCMQPDQLRRLRDVAPTVHMCNDAADEPWWPVIDEYYRMEAFDLQVSIDGSPVNPIAANPKGLTLLTPIDNRVFAPRPWAERDIPFGMVGGIGHTDREATIRDLMGRGLLDFRAGPGGRSYDEMARVMCYTKIAFNSPRTGTNTKKHVKGRVVEAGHAGCCLMEETGAPTSNWFTPGEDYLEYTDAVDVARLLTCTSDETVRDMAKRFYIKCLGHSPGVFWGKVFERLYA